jgi:hypothetical protein
VKSESGVKEIWPGSVLADEGKGEDDDPADSRGWSEISPVRQAPEGSCLIKGMEALWLGFTTQTQS